ncbi:hypothetical protein AAKU52_003084 [Pedobacter sp. CG_S7]|uniref:hypothetical protein n=1 Tax=Pedobacter sp. CG_S7 TaxID=3143930 RepID=UPI00339A38CA
MDNDSRILNIDPDYQSTLGMKLLHVFSDTENRNSLCINTLQAFGYDIGTNYYKYNKLNIKELLYFSTESKTRCKS